MRHSQLRTAAPSGPGPRPENGRPAMSRVGHMAAARAGVLQQETFQALLPLERRRPQESRKPFVLMLLDSHAVHATGGSAAFAERLASVVSDATRETDLVGWYEKD